MSCGSNPPSYSRLFIRTIFLLLCKFALLFRLFVPHLVRQPMATGGVRREKEKYLIEFCTYLFSQFLLPRVQMPSIGTARKEKTYFELVLCKFVISTKFVGPCLYLLHRDLVTLKTLFINFLTL